MATVTRHRLLEVATHDVVTRDQLLTEGVTEEGLKTLRRRSHLFERHRGVYLTTDRPSHRTLAYAAVRHCGDDALVSHLSAALLWDLVDDVEGWPFVTVPAHRMTHKADGIRVKRTRRPVARWERDLIPVTTLHRTIDDVARLTTHPSLKAILGRAERKRALELDALYAEATSPKLRELLKTYVAGRGLTDSELEALFFDIVAQTSLSAPQKQRRKAGGRVDFVWPELRLIVEVDGWDSHRGRVAFADDRRRDREHWREGFHTLRYTWSDVTLTPEEIVADLLLAAERVA